MRIEMAGNVTLSAMAEQVIIERAVRKLQRFRDVLESATITIEDVNGPKGGEDLRCQVIARLKGFPSVVVAKSGKTVMKTLAALDSARMAIAKHLEKRQVDKRHA